MVIQNSNIKTKQQERWNNIFQMIKMFTSYLFEFLCVSSHEYHRSTCWHCHDEFLSGGLTLTYQ